MPEKPNLTEQVQEDMEENVDEANTLRQKETVAAEFDIL